MRGLGSRRPRRLRDLPEDDGMTPVFLDGKPALVPCAEVEPYYRQQMAPYDRMNVYERYGVSIWGMRWGMAPPFQRGGIEIKAPRVATDPDFNAFREAGEAAMALTTRERNRMPAKDFALPGKGKGPKGKGAGAYPIEDKSHARNALARVAQHGTPAEKATVKRKVEAKFPAIAVGGKKGRGGREKEGRRGR